MIDDFVIVDGLVTVELLRSPSWLIRKRTTHQTMTTPYDWVANMSYLTSEECEVKGYLAGQRPMSKEDYATMQRIAGTLGFNFGLYEPFTIIRSR